MKSCIIFSCTIISEQRLIVLHRFLQTFQQHFLDSDLFIGINPNSLDEVESIINSYNLNVKFIQRCPVELYSESDASAYQIALKGLRDCNSEYENYWFIHTKSGVNEHSDYLREWYIDNFLSKRISIETFINETPDIGSYGMLGLAYNEMGLYADTDVEIDIFKNTITDDLPFTHAYFFYIHSLYVINKKPIHKFLNLITDKWFTTKLDRYYFEGVFPFIVSRSGYFPYIENRFDCSYNNLTPKITEWITINKLEQYQKYTDIFKTNFLFNQLNPPYVNSNS
jgi:hypothetical protein